MSRGRSVWSRLRREGGYFTVDATIALLILSLGLILSLNAGGQAWRVSQRALEVERANILMTQLLETRAQEIGEISGSQVDFQWRTDMETLGADPNVEVCTRSVAVTSKTSHRTYRMSTKTPCQSEAPGP